MPQRSAKATRPQAATADLAGGLAAEGRPAVVQTAGTTRPSEFAAAVPRRRAAFALAALSAAVDARYFTSILRLTISAPYLFHGSCARQTREVTPPVWRIVSCETLTVQARAAVFGVAGLSGFACCNNSQLVLRTDAGMWQRQSNQSAIVCRKCNSML